MSLHEIGEIRPYNPFVKIWVCAVMLFVGNGFLRVNRSEARAGANQQRARAVINEMIHALGGDAYLHLQDFQMEGRSGRFEHGASQGSTRFWRYWQWPDKERTEYTKQRDIVVLFKGDATYEITFRGARLLDPIKDADLRLRQERRKHALEIVLRHWLDRPGTVLFDEGTSITENHTTERITIMNAQNDTITLAVDTENHLPVKKVISISYPQSRDRDELAEIYDNWKTIQGIATPFEYPGFTRTAIYTVRSSSAEFLTTETCLIPCFQRLQNHSPSDVQRSTGSQLGLTLPQTHPRPGFNI